MVEQGLGDHPRIRGEHRRLDAEHHHRVRIIPAYAGSTKAIVCPSSEFADHPRIRGEHLPQTSCMAERQGSSPHTRGAPTDRVDGPRFPRIIPAYAGSTSSIASPTRSARDHPRIRGEHSNEKYRPRWRPGSSPHTRGARGRLSEIHRHRGIIPAYAGSTAPR